MKELPRDDHAKRRRDEQHDVAANDEQFSQHQRLRTTESLEDRVGEKSSEDEAHCVTDENESDNCVADVIMLLHVRDDGTRSCARSVLQH